MLRNSPDAFALAAITLVMLAITSARIPLPPPQPRWVVTPIRLEMQAHRDCIRAEMQAHRAVIRDAVQHSIAQAKRVISKTLRREY
ncbi:MAG TPA: hypothetical protein VFA28_13385 [Bryobacteraceae bacterium]|jgi:hypothetical protein|nr:hypothetical protein [Bryobacteraceae bacterium]